MSEIVQKITGKTLVPISLLIAMGGGGGWLTQMHYTSQANAQTLKEVQTTVDKIQRDYAKQNLANQKEIYIMLTEINHRLSRLEGHFNNN